MREPKMKVCKDRDGNEQKGCSNFKHLTDLFPIPQKQFSFNQTGHEPLKKPATAVYWLHLR
jgi:hypothetical protein